MKVNKSVLSDPLDDYTLCFHVDNKAIFKLKTEEQDGYKGLWSNLVINAVVSWKNMLKSLTESMATTLKNFCCLHGHLCRK